MLFFSESGCKGKNFFEYLPNIFGSFFRFFFDRPSALLRKEGLWEKKGFFLQHPAFRKGLSNIAASFSKAGAKVRTLSHIFQIFPEVFFLFSFPPGWFWLKPAPEGRKRIRSRPVRYQNVNSSPPPFPKAGAKVGVLSLQHKYIRKFFYTGSESFL